jgi:hypothetical protein
MILKWLVVGSVIYVLYKYFLGPNALTRGKNQDPHSIKHQEGQQQNPSSAANEDEYIDYEEVD